MADQRAGARVPSDRLVACLANGTRSLVQLNNLSQEGGMITAPEAALEPGDSVTLELFDGLCATGTVVWCLFGNAGLVFDDPLHPVVVLHLGWRKPAEAYAGTRAKDRFGRDLPSLGDPDRARAARPSRRSPTAA